jgi:hypothetical protein
MSGSQADIYEIFCIFEGQRTSWSVELAKNQSVAKLKEAIKNKKSTVLANVDADDLTLYQVDIHDDLKLVENVERKMLDNPTLLPGSMEMAALYPERPPNHSVHILIQLPSGRQPFNVNSFCDFADNHAVNNLRWSISGCIQIGRLSLP